MASGNIDYLLLTIIIRKCYNAPKTSREWRGEESSGEKGAKGRDGRGDKGMERKGRKGKWRKEKGRGNFLKIRA